MLLGTACVAAFTAAMRIKMFFMCPFESLGMAMATYSGQNYGAGKPERIWMGVKASALMMIVYWAFTFCVLMFGARTFALLFVDASELEILKNTELFLHISVSFFSGFGTALHPAIHYPGGGIYQSCHAFRCLGDDCPDTGQPAGCSGFRLSGRVFW